jgi:hypothetical protein
LVGDAINRSQHFPSDCDFLEPSGIGESGMTVVGTGAGMFQLVLVCNEDQVALAFVMRVFMCFCNLQEK